MNNNSSLLNISSNDILKKIFSHIEFNRFYNLAKYNKQLQDKLNINFKNNIQPNKYIERIEKNKLENNYNSRRDLFNSLITFGAHYVYFIAHYLINVPLFLTLNPDLYKSKDKYWNIITNIFFRIFSLFYHFFSAFVLYYILSNNKSDYIYRKIIFIMLTIIVIYFQCWYEIGLFHKIKLTFSFALNKKWIIFFDVIYAILNLSYIFFTTKALYSYFRAKIAKIYIKVNVLYLYKNIKIKEYKFKDNFELIGNKRKKISSEANNFENIYSEDDKELIQNINDYRIEKNLSELIIDKKIPNFIIKGSTEIFLTTKNIIKLSDIKYVIIFKNYVDYEGIEENKEIMDILLKPFLNKINIIQQGITKYITIYEDIYEKNNYNAIKIKDNLTSENLMLKTNIIN